MSFFLTRLFLGLWLSLPLTLLATASEDEGQLALRALIKANDGLVSEAIRQSEDPQLLGNRGMGARIMVFALAYTNERSALHHDARLVPGMERFATELKKNLHPNHVFDVGAQKDSPPDSAFVLKTLARGQWLLTQDNRPETGRLRTGLKELILEIAEGVRTGGVHTPNQRWAVCSGLAYVNRLYPSQTYVDRIDDWLGEGLDIDADGQWSERSANYDSDVNDPAMIDLAILLGRPELLDAVRSNLETTLYFMEPNGEMETVASRRQDQSQRSRKHIWEYYASFRFMAVHDSNGRFAAITRRIERDFIDRVGAMATALNSPVTYLVEFPEMLKPLPASNALPENYAKVFPLSELARIRRGTTTATIFGGSDWHEGWGAGSGLSTNPSFFKFRKGQAVLDSVRLTPAFFSTGFFHPDTLTVTGPDEYQLVQKLAVPYHFPLPPEYRRPDGQYRLAGEGRFYSRMDFPHRPKKFVTLVTKVTVREHDGAFELEFDVTGHDDVPVTLELCFRKDGKLTGVVEPPFRNSPPADGRVGPPMENEPDSFMLKEGFGSFTAGTDVIEFGPGTLAHARLRMEGERYGTYNGQNLAEGYRVYLTGTTPFKHTLFLK